LGWFVPNYFESEPKAFLFGTTEGTMQYGHEIPVERPPRPLLSEGILMEMKEFSA
jgi:hypothetical protein